MTGMKERKGRRPDMALALALALALVIGLWGQGAVAQEVNHAGMDHGAMMGSGDPIASTPTLPREPGQGAFAAVAEIVAILMQDPLTDWRLVDITALRAHLVDMDRLITDTVVSERQVPGGVEISVVLGPRDASAALRMVPAHAPVLKGETGWVSVLEDQGERLIWTVTSPGDGIRIRALGFFGLMALGDHHRAHHIALARGAPMH